MKNYYVYILASKPNGTLYIGMTNDLVKRVYEHKNNLIDGFTKKYKIHRLVYLERTSDVEQARPLLLYRIRRLSEPAVAQ